MEEMDINNLIIDDSQEKVEDLDILGMYLKEISRYPLLTIDEEKELVKKIKEGDNEALKRLVNSNLRLVIYYIKTTNKRLRKMEFLDLIQEGNIGLMRAAELYDPQKSGKFSSYAMIWINQAIQKALGNKENAIRTPIYKSQQIQKYYHFTAKYIQNNGHEPTDELIMTELHLKKKEYEEILSYINNKKNLSSLNQEISKEDNKNELGDFISHIERGFTTVDDDLDRLVLLHKLKKVLRVREYYIIYYRFFYDPVKTLEELAIELNVSRERIRQIESMALEKAKHYVEHKEKLNLKEIQKENLEVISIIEKVVLLYLRKSIGEDAYNVFYRIYHQKKSLSNVSEELKISEELVKGIYDDIVYEYPFILKISQNKYQELFLEMQKNYSINDLLLLDVTPQKVNFGLVEQLMNTMSEEEIYEALVGATLDKHTSKLLHRYYCKNQKVSNQEIERVNREINLNSLGYDTYRVMISTDKLFTTYLKNKDLFTKDTQNILEETVFAKMTRKQEKSWDKHVQPIKMALIRLENMYYHLNDSFSIIIPQEEIEKIINSDDFTIEEKEIIEEYYGIGGRKYKIKEMAHNRNIPYLQMHGKVFSLYDRIVNLYLKGPTGIKIVDDKRYHEYILNSEYIMTEETREVLRLLIIEKLSRDEIQKRLKITSKTRLSNIITDGIRKMDTWYYRLEELPLARDKVLEVLNDSRDLYDEEQRIAIIDRFINGNMMYDINNKKQGSLKEFKVRNRRFKDHFYAYYGKDQLEESDVIRELSYHITDSVLSSQERLFLSLKYGIKNEYNLNGKKYVAQEIMEFMNINKNVYYHFNQDTRIKINCRKKGIINPFYGNLTHEEVSQLLEIDDIPITPSDKETLRYIKGIDTEAKSLVEAAKLMNLPPATVNRKAKRALLMLNKYTYENRKDIGYETDIKPILKYFPMFDCLVIKMRYLEKQPISRISDYFSLTKEQTINHVNRIDKRVRYIIKCGTDFAFDFDYAREVIFNENLPYYGNIKKAHELYCRRFGDDGLAPYSFMNKFDEEEEFNYIATKELMLAVLKYRDGLRKTKMPSLEEIKFLYEKKKDFLYKQDKEMYERTIKAYQSNPVVKSEDYISRNVLYDYYVEKGNDIYDIRQATNIDKIIHDNPYKLTKIQIRYIKDYFNLPERNFISGKDRLKLFRAVAPYVINYAKDKHLRVKKEEQKTISEGARLASEHIILGSDYFAYRTMAYLKNKGTDEKSLTTHNNIDLLLSLIAARNEDIDYLTKSDTDEYLFELIRYALINYSYNEYQNFINDPLKRINTLPIPDMLKHFFNSYKKSGGQIIVPDKKSKLFTSFKYGYLNLKRHIDDAEVVFKDNLNDYYQKIVLGNELNNLSTKKFNSSLQEYLSYLASDGVFICFLDENKKMYVNEAINQEQFMCDIIDSNYKRYKNDQALVLIRHR